MRRLSLTSEGILSGYEMEPGEYGCYASHRAVIERIAWGGDKFVCVLEDDAVLASDLHIILDEGALDALPPFDVLRLRDNGGPRLAVASVGNLSVYAPYRPGWGAHAQIYTRSGAAKILPYLRPARMAIDLTLFSFALVPRLRTLDVAPALARQRPVEEVPSTIKSHNPGHQLTTVPTHWDVLRWRLFEWLTGYRLLRNFLQLWGLRAMWRLSNDLPTMRPH